MSTLNEALSEIKEQDRDAPLYLQINGVLRPYRFATVRNITDEHGREPEVLILSADDAGVMGA